MLRNLKHRDDPTMRSSGTEAKRARKNQQQNSARADLLLAAREDREEAMQDVLRDADLTSEEVANICNVIHSFQGTQAKINDIGKMSVTIDRLTAMFQLL